MTGTCKGIGRWIAVRLAAAGADVGTADLVREGGPQRVPSPGGCHESSRTAGRRAIDLACRSGVITEMIADAVDLGGSVVGLDFNPPMLEVAR